MAITPLSHVIDAMIDVAERLEAAAWPIHDTTARPPKVGAETEAIETPDEWVDISSRTDDNSSIEWVRIGNDAKGRRDERFWIDVLIESSVPGTSRIVALQRLNVLKAVVEGMFHDDNGNLLPVGVSEDWAVNLGGVRQVVARADRTDEGYVGACIISIAVAARI